MSLAFVQSQQKGKGSPPTANTIQKMLDENIQLIQAILDYQNKGRASECVQYQLMLHRNLVYLATVADSNLNVQAVLPAPGQAMSGQPGSQQPSPQMRSAGNMPNQMAPGGSMQSSSQMPMTSSGGQTGYSGTQQSMGGYTRPQMPQQQSQNMGPVKSRTGPNMSNQGSQQGHSIQQQQQQQQQQVYSGHQQQQQPPQQQQPQQPMMAQQQSMMSQQQTTSQQQPPMMAQSGSSQIMSGQNMSQSGVMMSSRGMALPNAYRRSPSQGQQFTQQQTYSQQQFSTQQAFSQSQTSYSQQPGYTQSAATIQQNQYSGFQGQQAQQRYSPYNRPQAGSTMAMNTQVSGQTGQMQAGQMPQSHIGGSGQGQAAYNYSQNQF